MIGTALHDLAAKHHLTIASGMAYGILNGCFVTFSNGKDNQCISIYVGPQEAPMPGYAESRTVSCSRQIMQAISTASGADNAYCLMTGNENVPALVLNHAGSVVTVHFPDTPEATAGIERFISEVLPQLAPLTQPQHCIFCAQPTGSEGCPVRLSGDTVVPMHTACCKRASDNYRKANPKPGSLGKGILGAALGALLGAILLACLYNAGILARVVSLLIGLFASLGYTLLKGRPGREKVITVILCSLIAVLLGAFAGSLLPFVQKYQSLGESTKHVFAEYATSLPAWMNYVRASISGSGGSYWFSLGWNVLFCAVFAGIGCIDLLRNRAAGSADAARPRRLRGKC